MKLFSIQKNSKLQLLRPHSVTSACVIDILDLADTQAAGFGAISSAVRSATGEYLERHFFKLISGEEIDGRKFVTTYDIINRKLSSTHLSSISLGAPGYSELGLTDSSGCASHSTAERAFEAALAEFIERQDLLYWWNTGNFQSSMKISTEKDLYLLQRQIDGSAESKYFFNDMLQHNRAYILLVDTSFASRAHKSFVALYLSNAPQNCVRFAMASASGRIVTDVLKKVLQELRHAFLGMQRNIKQLIESEELNLDPILANFILANKSSTQKFFSDEIASAVHNIFDSSILSAPAVHIGEPILGADLRPILPWASEIQLLLRPAPVGGHWAWFSKVMSSDGYQALHHKPACRPRIEGGKPLVPRSRYAVPFP